MRIDIGFDGCKGGAYVAVLRDGELSHFVDVRDTNDPWPLSLPTYTHFERPEINMVGQTAGKSPRGSIDVRSSVDQLYAVWRQVSVAVLYTPNQWKSTVPKPLHHRRILAQLSPAEVNVIDRSFPRLRAYVARKHDEWALDSKLNYRGANTDYLDALGVAMFGCGRIDNKGNAK